MIKLCIFAVSIGVFAFFGYRIYNQYANKNNKSNEKILAVVKNLSFDERKNLLTWGSVNHADSYIANINGVEYNVELNEMNYVPVSNTTEFKVKAVDSTGEYATPSWSKTYSYTLNNEFSYLFSSCENFEELNKMSLKEKFDFFMEHYKNVNDYELIDLGGHIYQLIHINNEKIKEMELTNA